MLSYQLRPSQVAVVRTDATRRLCGRYDRLSGRSNRDGWADHRGQTPKRAREPGNSTPLLFHLLSPHSSLLISYSTGSSEQAKVSRNRLYLINTVSAPDTRCDSGSINWDGVPHLSTSNFYSGLSIHLIQLQYLILNHGGWCISSILWLASANLAIGVCTYWQSNDRSSESHSAWTRHDFSPREEGLLRGPPDRSRPGAWLRDPAQSLYTPPNLYSKRWAGPTWRVAELRPICERGAKPLWGLQYKEDLCLDW